MSNMKGYFVNKEILEHFEINLNEFCALIGIEDDLDESLDHEVLKSLEEKRFLKLKRNNIVFRNRAKTFFSTISKEVNFIGGDLKVITRKTEREINQEIENRIDEYRNVFKGLKIGSMGSPRLCKENLFKFLEENSKYTIDDVIKAAKIYIKSLNDFKYLQRADYFIYKQRKDKTITSTLEAFIEETDINDNDWTSKLN